MFALLEGFGSPGHWLVLLIIGILLFGKRLPEMGRALGKGIVEFKKGLKGIEDEVENSVTRQESPAIEQQPKPPQRVAASAPKFDTSAAPTDTEPKV